MEVTRTAESVSAGHADKIADQISDAILDAVLAQDPQAKVAVETLAGHKQVVLMGEVCSQAKVDYKDIAQKLLYEFGYSNYQVLANIVQQSSEIAEHVEDGGAGDQGIMVGYACDETKEMLPLEFALARRLTRAMGLVDGKSQVTIQGKDIIRLVTSVGAEYPVALLGELSAMGIHDDDSRWIRNQYETAGLNSDTGLTGRKIVVDAYGPRVPVGGGAFSGKDPSKVDRSAAYMARKVAVDLLKKLNAHEVIVKLAYSIGMREELMATADVIHEDGRYEHIAHVTGYDFSPASIIELLNLRLPQYLKTARYGHFGNGYVWDN
ncbi:MAG: methionine adenosyltransferase domain-containing protein [Patescibacteria group bacterium]|jgi:S-adenosylmethionine synthetase